MEGWNVFTGSVVGFARRKRGGSSITLDEWRIGSERRTLTHHIIPLRCICSYFVECLLAIHFR